MSDDDDELAAMRRAGPRGTLPGAAGDRLEELRRRAGAGRAQEASYYADGGGGAAAGRGGASPPRVAGGRGDGDEDEDEDDEAVRRAAACCVRGPCRARWRGSARATLSLCSRCVFEATLTLRSRLAWRT
jgi:hypothetical protein